MLLCFGSRRKTRQQRRHWNDKDFLLGDEHQAIVNPYFLESGNVGLAQLEVWHLKRLDILLLIQCLPVCVDAYFE